MTIEYLDNSLILEKRKYFVLNEKIFYKFIIPGEYKSKILRKLYLDGYSEEYLFPGYKGVADAMKNRIALEKVDSD